MAYNWKSTITIAHAEVGHEVVVTIGITDFLELPECLRQAADTAARMLGQPVRDLAAENAGLRAEVEALKRHLMQLQCRGVGGGGAAAVDGAGGGGGSYPGATGGRG